MTELPAADMTGLRVLVVEDQMIVAMEIENCLREVGCAVVGPVGKLEPAVRLARMEPLGAAILDVNLNGQQVFPVAEALQARDIPFAFFTGYGESTLPEKWRGLPRLCKPFMRDDIETLIRSIMTSKLSS